MVKKCYSFLSETKRYDQEYGAVYGGGMCGIAAALPRFKITVNSGNITECDVTIYGVTNPGNSIMTNKTIIDENGKVNNLPFNRRRTNRI